MTQEQKLQHAEDTLKEIENSFSHYSEIRQSYQVMMEIIYRINETTGEEKEHNLLVCKLFDEKHDKSLKNTLKEICK